MYSIVGAILVLSSVILLSYRKYILSLSDDERHNKWMAQYLAK